MLKRWVLLPLLGLVGVCVVLIAVAATRTLLLPPSPPPLGAPKALQFDHAQAIEHFASAIRIRSVSHADQPPDPVPMTQLHDLIEHSFPRVQATLKREIIGAGALLYVWPGSDSALKPALLMGHMDVVPVDTSTDEQWTHPPFSGLVADNMVWGRGTLDDKSTVFSILEATEALLAEGFVPRRTMLFAFGDDEEVGGSDGAAQIVAALKQRGVQLEFVLDEGGSVVRGVVPGVAGDVALIGIAEKGYASLKLQVKATGGHSSMPPPETAIGILSRALATLEAHPMPAHLTTVSEQMFDAIAPPQPFAQRMVLTNRWLFEPLIVRLIGSTPAGAATLRTTTAETIVSSGVGENVLPTEAHAVVNFRILPGDTLDDIVAHVRDTIADPRVEISQSSAGQSQSASPISSTNSYGFITLTKTIQAEFPEATVAPYLVVGATDSAHYEPLTGEIFRFSPILLEAPDLDRMHGTDERLPVDRYLHSVQFMSTLMRNVAG